MTCDGANALNIYTVMLWMNSGCNARCITCEIWREKVGTYLSAAEIAEHASKWRERGVKLVELCGEATIHPELVEICAAFTANGLRFSFLSNGLRLGAFSRLIVEQAVSLTVSLDGPPDIHDRVRGVPRAFERLEQGLKVVRALSGTFPVYGRCAVHRENFLHMSDTVETARSLGLTSISFFGIDTDTPAFGREYLDAAAWRDRAMSLAFQADEMEMLDQEVGRLLERRAADFENRFIVESPQLLRLSLSPHQRSRAGNGQLANRCNAPFKSAVVEPNGDVKPCWFLPSHGNLRRAKDLHAVLEAPEAVSFRNELSIRDNKVCQRCITPRVFDESGASKSGFPL